MDTYFSNFDTHLFLVPLTALTAGTADQPLPSADLAMKATGTSAYDYEIQSVTSFDRPNVTKDIKRVKVINGEGYDEIIPLGQAAGDAQLSFVRPAVGVYSGPADTDNDNYTKMKSWFENGITNQFGNYMCLVLAQPRIASAAASTKSYEGTAYIVMPTEFADGPIDPDNGQEFTMTMAVQRKPYAISITRDSTTGIFTWDV